MLAGEADIGAGQFRDARFKILPGFSSGAPQDLVKSLKAAKGQGVEKRLLAGKVPPGRCMANAQFTTELPQGNALNSTRLQRFLGGAEQGIAQMAMVVGPGRCLHFQHLISNRRKLQYVSIDNIVSNGYIGRVV